MWKLQGKIKNKLALSFINLIYPSSCPRCSKTTDNFPYAPICTGCWEGIMRYDGPLCRVCSAPLVSEYASVCGECLKKPPPFSKAIIFGLYKDTLKEAINQFKFLGIKRLGRPLAGLLSSVSVPEADCIIPVPMEKSGLLKRGFNQTLLLSMEVSKTCGMPVEREMLYKKRKTSPQVGLPREERLSNLKGAFGVKGNLKGKNVILLDDVMTTGATVSECSKELIRAGAEGVTVLVLARAEGL